MVGLTMALNRVRGDVQKKNSIFTDIVQIGGGRSTSFQKIEKK